VEAREGERSGGRVALPHYGAPAGRIRRRGAVKRRHGGLPKHGGDDGGGSSGARVLQAEAVAAAWDS
jgi:hypothetical protein